MDFRELLGWHVTVFSFELLMNVRGVSYIILTSCMMMFLTCRCCDVIGRDVPWVKLFADVQWPL